MLSPREISEHAAGKGLDAKDEALVGDWAFDRLEGGAYPNSAGEGLAARPIGKVRQVGDNGGGYVRLEGGRLEVANGNRLDISTALTMEAWVRPAGPQGGGCLFARQRVWMWGFVFHARSDWIMLDGLRASGREIEANCKIPSDKWTHIAGILGAGGLWQIWVDGKLVKEYKTRPMIISG